MIYVHIPFCRSFCTYCDFYSERACPGRQFVDEICAEALRRKDEIAASAAIDTLYFGGGTPSVLPLCDAARIADACGGRKWREWTVEVNPDDISPQYAAGLRELGVNRVSMGVQSLDDGLLKWMNRRHSSDGARQAFRMLREAGFDNVSVDIIFGINGLSMAALEATLAEIISWRPEHISAYQLSVEPGSALGRMVRDGSYVELGDDDCSRQYYFICSALAAAGYEHYEISNWALPGRRAVHNSAYWTRAPYVGLGPGAHSLRCRAANTTIPLHPQGTRGERGREMHSAYSEWFTQNRPGQNAGTISRNEIKNSTLHFTAKGTRETIERSAGYESKADYRSWNSESLSGWTAEGEQLSDAEIREERIMLGLRTADGIPADILQENEISRQTRNDSLVPSAAAGNLRIPEDRWFTADDIIASLI